MTVDICVGDALSVLRDMPDASVHCVITSPPYWGLRKYGGDPGMIGLEETLDQHLDNLVAVFREVWRVLRPDGTLWLNYGDAYARGDKRGSSGPGDKQASNRGSAEARGVKLPAGQKPKDLMGLPWRVAFALQDDGWWLRSDVIVAKSNPMPESAKDRPTRAHEFVFLMTKAPRYFYDAEAVKEPVSGTANARRSYKTPDGWDTGPGAHGTIHRKGREKGRVPGVPPKSAPAGSGIRQNDNYQAAMVDQPAMRNLRDVWTLASAPFKGAHFATFPPALCERPIKAGTSEYGVCPDCGVPWTRQVGDPYPAVGMKSGNKELKHRGADANYPDQRSGGHRGTSIPYEPTRRDTTSWRPTCTCYDDRYRAEHPEPRRARKRHQRAAWGGRWKRVRARAGNPDWPVVPAVVLDPFGGAGTVGLVAERLGRDSILIEINPGYAEMARKRIEDDVPPRPTERPAGPVCDPEDLPLFAPTKAA